MANYTSDVVLEELQPIFEEALDQPGIIVKLNSSAMNTPNWDSLAHIEMIELVERHFNVKFALTELQDLKTVGDLVSRIVEKSAQL